MTAVFTGLVEGVGKVVPSTGETTFVVEAGALADGVQIGDSVAVNGCCLTVTAMGTGRLSFDLLAETRARTNLFQMTPGARVNLERALPANGRYGGHFVTGHIDATGEIRAWEKKGDDYELRIGMKRSDGVYLVPKGCIAVDGISLTVAEVGEEEFSVWIIPHTRAVTALQARAVGDLLNLEFDLLAKYTEKILATRLAQAK